MTDALIVTFSLVLNYILIDLFYLNKSSDQWITKWYIINYKNGFNGYKYKNSLIDGKQADPRWYYSFLGLCCSLDKINFIGKLFNFICHVGTYILLGIVLYFIGNVSFHTSIIVSSTFSLTPILFPQTARLNSIKSRTFGKLIVFSIMILIYLNYSFIFIPAVILCLILVGSSAMATQYCLFILISYNLININTNSIYTLFTSAFLISVFGIGLKDVIKFKFYHMKWYIKMLDLHFLASQKNILLDFIFWKKNRISHNILLLVLFGCPILIIMPFIFDAELMKSNSIYEHSIIIIICTFILIVITGIKPLTIFGQAERYLEYAIPFIAIIFAYSNYIEYVYLLLLVNLSIILISCKENLIKNSMKYNNSLEADAIKVVDKLTHNKKIDIKILSFPFKLAYKIDISLTGNYKIYLEWFFQKNGLAYMIDDSYAYSVPKQNFEYYHNKYGVNIIFIDKLEYHNYYGNVETNLKKYQKLYDNERYCILHL